MSPRVTLALALLAAFATSGRGDEPPEVPSFARQRPAIRSGEPSFRFNGKDLSGFYTYLHDNKFEDPKKVFTVKDGIIVVSGEEFGGFATKDAFRDYHLVVEWRWGKRTWPPRVTASRDSGILLHGTGPDGAAGGQWLQSLECQIIEGGCGDLLMVGGLEKTSLTCTARTGPDGGLYYDPSAPAVTRDSGRYNWWGRDPKWKDVLGYRGPRDVEKPAGEWNLQEVYCDGDTITNLVNGLVVNVGTKASQSEGKIQFQSEGAEIHFRTIEIRPLLKP